MFRRLILIILALLSILIPVITSGCEPPPQGSAEWYFAQASKLASEGNYTEAINNYSDAIRVEPLMAKLYVNRAATYEMIGNYDAAIADCNKALSLESDLPLAYINLAYADNSKGNYNQAIQDSNKAIQLNSKLGPSVY